MNRSINTDSKNSKEPQQKYRLGTVSIKILGGLNHLVLFNGAVKITPYPINVVYPIYQRFIRPPIPIIRFMIILIVIYLFTLNL